MNWIHKLLNASYNFKVPNATGNADKKIEVLFPSVEVQTPVYNAAIALAVTQMCTNVGITLTGDSTLTVTVDKDVTLNAEMLLVLTASGGARTVTLSAGFTGSAIPVPSGATVNVLLKYDGTNFVVVTSTNDNVQDGSIVVAKLADNAVETAKIKDGNVTLAKLAAGTAGDIIYFNGTSWVVIHKGTDGQTLKLASGVPTWTT